eukprot:COSAG01_NODE_3829_length_5652_cov_6.370250_7_plen_204_part_00
MPAVCPPRPWCCCAAQPGPHCGRAQQDLLPPWPWRCWALGAGLRPWRARLLVATCSCADRWFVVADHCARKIDARGRPAGDCTVHSTYGHNPSYADLRAGLGPSYYADLSFSSSYESHRIMLHGQILIHDASFRFMFLYVILISQTWLDLPAEQRLADLQRLAETCEWLAGYAVARQRLQASKGRAWGVGRRQQIRRALGVHR